MFKLLPQARRQCANRSLLWLQEEKAAFRQGDVQVLLQQETHLQVARRQPREVQEEDFRLPAQEAPEVKE
jgi:hypothetical protein